MHGTRLPKQAGLHSRGPARTDHVGPAVSKECSNAVGGRGGERAAQLTFANPQGAPTQATTVRRCEATEVAGRRGWDPE